MAIDQRSATERSGTASHERSVPIASAVREGLLLNAHVGISADLLTLGHLHLLTPGSVSDLLAAMNAAAVAGEGLAALMCSSAAIPMAMTSAAGEGTSLHMG